MPSHGDKKGRLRASAVTALMTSSTVKAAADKANVSETTLHRWMRDPEFAAELDAAQNDLIAQTARNLAALSPASIAAIAAALSPSAPVPVRLSGARLQLDAALRFAELLQFERRLGALEEAIQAAQGTPPATVAKVDYRIAFEGDDDALDE